MKARWNVGWSVRWKVRFEGSMECSIEGMKVRWNVQMKVRWNVRMKVSWNVRWEFRRAVDLIPSCVPSVVLVWSSFRWSVPMDASRDV